MSTTIESLTKPVTRDEAKESIYNVLATVGVNTTSWKPGAVVRTIIAAVAILFAACTNLIAEIAKAGFLELTSGAWLTLVARYVYGVTRLEATFGTGTLRLVNTGGGIYDLDPGDLVVRNPDTDKTYTNVATFHLGVGETISIDIIAQEAGSASTSTVGAIVSVVTGLGATVAVNNTTAVVGADEEQDDPLKQRCRDTLGARSANGPSDAYATIARSALRADGSAIGVQRVRIVKDGKGNVYVYLATPSGDVDGDAEDIDTDLGAINDQIQRTVAPLGVTAHTRSATPLVVDVAYQIWMLDTSGLTGAQVAALVTTALGKYFAAAPIGGYVIDGEPGRIYLDDLKAAIKAVRPEIFHVVLVGLTDDIDVGFTSAPVLGLSSDVSIVESQQRVI